MGAWMPSGSMSSKVADASVLNGLAPEIAALTEPMPSDGAVRRGEGGQGRDVAIGGTDGLAVICMLSRNGDRKRLSTRPFVTACGAGSPIPYRTHRMR